MPTPVACDGQVARWTAAAHIDRVGIAVVDGTSYCAGSTAKPSNTASGTASIDAGYLLMGLPRIDRHSHLANRYARTPEQICTTQIGYLPRRSFAVMYHRAA